MRTRACAGCAGLERSIVAIAALTLLVGPSACRATAEPTVALAGSDGRSVEVIVEIARTSAELRRGLMWRDEMARDHGMLFVFANESERSFWMKNTPLPLDILYIDSSARIVSIAENTTPYSTKSIPSRGPARYVLEVNGGFCREHGIVAGSTVRLPDLSASADAAPAG
jgi:uncharacterized membrane protein (UPF0127 family)